MKCDTSSKPFTASDHTFVICAFGESEYIEECISSLQYQDLKTNVIVCTSTPSDFLKKITDKYRLKLYVNEKVKFCSNIATDWNYAIDMADTPLVTIAHQDDIYKPDYSKKIIEGLNKANRPLIAFTDYYELRNGMEISNIRNLNIKRMMLLPLRFRILWHSVFVRRRILSLGSPICCPSVTYVRPNLPKQLFLSGYKVNLDWQAWERFSQLKGDFVYVNDLLMSHRIHERSETSRNIGDSNRSREDLDMFCKFWPESIAGFIEGWYKKGEEQNNLHISGK